MFSFGSKLYRFSEQSGELVLSWNDDSRRQWRAIHLPSALRTQALQDLCFARGAGSLFILSRPEQKVYHMYSDLSLSKKISFINMDAMSNRVNSIAHIDGSYCIMGFTPDMHGYIIDGKKGGRFLAFSTAPSTVPTEVFPRHVTDVHMVSVGTTIYAIIHCNQTSCELLQVDLKNCICTTLATHSFDHPTKLLYVVEANPHILAFYSSRSTISSSMGDREERNSTASFTLSMSSSRMGETLFAVVFRVPLSSVPVAKRQSKAVLLLTELPDVFRKECIYHNGRLVAYDGSNIIYEPLSRLLSAAMDPVKIEISKPVHKKEATTHVDSFSINLSEISRCSDRDNQTDHNLLARPILRQSTGFGNNRERSDILRDAIPLTAEMRDAYEYLGISIEGDHVSLDLLTKGLVGAIVRLRMTETAAAAENLALRKQVDELKESLDAIKRDSEAQMGICQNFNGVIDDLMADRTNVHNTLTKIEANIAELAQQQLIVAAKRQKCVTSKTAGPDDNHHGSRSPEKDLTTSDISATTMTKRDLVGSTGINMSTQTKRAAKTEKVKKSVSSPVKTTHPSYKEIEMAVQQTLRSLSPTRRVIQAPPQPVLYSMTPSTSLIDKTSRSNLDVELLLLRDENERLRRQSTARSMSTPSVTNYNSAISPSSMAERLRLITRKMNFSMGRARKIETALDAVDRSGHTANLDVITE